MKIDESSLAQVAETAREALSGYVELLTGLAGERLLGLTFFGEVLNPAFDPVESTAANVVVLEQIDLGLLRQVAENGRALGSEGIRAPLAMTPAYIRGSRDTFPLELLEIHQRHVTLVGEDHFAALEFHAEHLRLQCERELKRLLIGLRQGLLAAAGREQWLGEMEVDAGLQLLRTMRGLLWLKGQKAYLPRMELIAETEKLTGGPLAGARVAGDAHFEHGWEAFQALYRDIERLSAYVDGM